LAGSLNSYSYVSSGTIESIDPTGEYGFLGIPGICAGGCEGIGAALGLGAYLSTPSGQKAAQDAAGAVTDALTSPTHCCTHYTDVYEGDDKHGATARPGPGGTIPPEPTNGQLALSTSVSVGRERIGFDPTAGQLVIFRNHFTDEKNRIKYWHAYVVTQKDLTPQQWRAGRDAGFPNWPRKPK